MSNDENRASGFFGLIPLALVAAVICAIAVLLMPAHASSEASTQVAAAEQADDDSGYLPARIVNRGMEAEPVQEIGY